jgi:predicted phage terminase large subunit-like protein
VHVVVGMDRESRLYVLDLWREQTSSEKWIEVFCDLVLRWRAARLGRRARSDQSEHGPFLSRRQHERSAYVNREPFPTRGDKAVRAQSIRGRMALEGLYVPVHAPWYPAFRAELLSFPAGKHDDQVDALGLIGNCWTSWCRGG